MLKIGAPVATRGGPMRFRCSRPRSTKPARSLRANGQHNGQHGGEDHKGEHPASSETLAGCRDTEWAWVELNYRPHAYQAPKPGDNQRPSA